MILTGNLTDTSNSSLSRQTKLKVLARHQKLPSLLSSKVDDDDSVTLIGSSDRLNGVYDRPGTPMRESFSNSASLRRRSRSYGHRSSTYETLNIRPRTSLTEMTEM